jgi:SAM-dependent methyltransferase
MSLSTDIPLPEEFEALQWVERWDRMQDRYLVRRRERFEMLVRMLRATQPPGCRVLDLGCGPGSLTLALLESMPEAQVWGIDFDRAVLLLARERLARCDHGPGCSAHFMLADLRDGGWIEVLPAPVDAVVSATALHWLRPGELATLYRRIAEILRPGGIFINADHVGSDFAPIQEAWEEHRQQMRAAEAETTAAAMRSVEEEDWDGFWEAYACALGSAREAGQRALGGWEGGVEEGLPLAWHLDRLRESGFRAVDCFWRCDCDAIYGGIRRGD